MTNTYVTHAVAELFYSGNGSVRITHAASEVWIVNPSKVRVTHAAFEAWVANPSKARVTHIGYELWRSVSSIVQPSYHRYWRVNITNNGYGGYPSIAELALALSTGGATATSGGTAISSAISGAGYEAAKAFDGSGTTWWNGASSFPGWVGYDFGSGNSVSVAEVRITARTDSSDGAHTAPSAFSVDYSDDGSTWTTYANYNSAAAWTQGETRTFAAAGAGVVAQKPTSGGHKNVRWGRAKQSTANREAHNRRFAALAAVLAIPQSVPVTRRKRAVWFKARPQQPRAFQAAHRRRLTAPIVGSALFYVPMPAPKRKPSWAFRKLLPPQFQAAHKRRIRLVAHVRMLHGTRRVQHPVRKLLPRAFQAAHAKRLRVAVPLPLILPRKDRRKVIWLTFWPVAREAYYFRRRRPHDFPRTAMVLAKKRPATKPWRFKKTWRVHARKSLPLDGYDQTFVDTIT